MILFYPEQTSCTASNVLFRVSSHYNWEQEKRLNVEKFIILQVCYYIYRAIVFNNKNSLYPSRREYINVLNCGQNVQVNCFFQAQAILESVRKLEKKIFFVVFNLFFQFAWLSEAIVCIILFFVLIKKLLGKKSFKNPMIYIRQKKFMLGDVCKFMFSFHEK